MNSSGYKNIDNIHTNNTLHKILAYNIRSRRRSMYMVIRIEHAHGLLSQRLISIRSILPMIHKGNITIRHILRCQRSTPDKAASCIIKSPGFPGIIRRLVGYNHMRSQFPKSLRGFCHICIEGLDHCPNFSRVRYISGVRAIGPAIVTRLWPSLWLNSTTTKSPGWASFVTFIYENSLSPGNFNSSALFKTIPSSGETLLAYQPQLLTK
ncbi:uncharacterized protein K444DRAFT_89987 [Hyaloscypha bicolor E]|uniref:Uncharacterized protein n=1 Tax=Hyaloscypha bicolor E TaxID=1095630 RepID=A0A2J6SXL8_9HELO|nr:uncharacterized protein K444DRAFT_89987 [Hyaloscypha bicolor E]PMD55527.1 hypothetical protein K444DRAFT_89987 [Hyaloscypha bicolor E]